MSAARPSVAKAPPPSLDVRVAQLESTVAQQAAQIAELLEAARIVKAIGAIFNPEEVADDYELDSKYGDPQVKKDPSARYWQGATQINRRLSECPPDYLDAFAKWKDSTAKFFASQGTADKLKAADFARKDAARARGWSKRIRGGWKPPPKPTLANGFTSMPLGGPAGFGHAPFGSAPAFGGGSPFGKPPPKTDDQELFGADRPADRGDAYEPDDDALELPGGDDSFPTGGSEQSGTRPAASAPNRIELDDDDDDLPLMETGDHR